ncbi:hypothetical protein EDB80DRAFT_285740 [Ilyonectria destructans]|nr:hypothetical protein EDB80DRAFT_285740 [Ilyonectria destructans]
MGHHHIPGTCSYILTTLIVIAAVGYYYCSLLTPTTCLIVIAITIIIINFVPLPTTNKATGPTVYFTLLSPLFNASPSLAPPSPSHTRTHTDTHPFPSSLGRRFFRTCFFLPILPN